MLKHIGKYQVLEEIGRGGFGRVYRCFDPTVGRAVAVKLLLPDAAETEHLARFRMEAATTASLRHRNLVVIHAFGEQDGMPYLVMEFLEGEDLQKRMSSPGGMTLLEQIEIMQQVADGLHSAHQSGVVHRDVKPSNIMILRDASVKIMDFGIARLTRADSTRMTRSGFLVGTLSYMSPEQFAGGDVDPLCDIWAYGVIYYELVTGRHPFESGNSHSLMWAIANREPEPVRTYAPSCPATLEKIILRAMAKDRELRYQSLEELRMDVEPILVDLRREKAQSLLPEAHQLFFEQRWDETQALVRKILELNPLEPEARKLRERILEQSQRRAILPRLVALRNTAAEHLKARRFPDAVQTLEAALRLDPASTDLKEALQKAKEAYESSRRATQLLDTALADLNQERLTSANQMVAEACRIDPDNPRVPDVMDRLQNALSDRDRAAAAVARMEQARVLSATGNFEEAMGVLAELEQRYPATPGLAELKQAVERGREEQRRRARREQGFQAVRASLNAGDLAAALRQLDQLQPEFTSDPEHLSLRQEVQAALERRRLEERVAQALAKARELHNRNDLDSAIRSLESAIRELGEHSALVDLLAEFRRTRDLRLREASIQQALQAIEAHRTQNNFNAANTALEYALSQFPGEPRLIALKDSVGADLRRAARRQEHSETVATMRTLIVEKRYPEAMQRATQWLEKWGADPEVEDLLQSARRLDAEARTREARRQLIQRVHAAESAGQMAQALRLLEADARQFPNDPELADLHQRISDQLRREQEAQLLARRIQDIETALTKNQLERAASLLIEFRQLHPTESAGPRLQTRLSHLQEESRIQQAVSNIEAALNRRRLAEARSLLQSALAAAPGQARLLQLQTRLDTEQTIDDSIERARHLLAERKPELAEASVRSLFSLHPEHSALRSFRKEIENLRDEIQKDHRKTLRELANKLAKGQFEDVIALSSRSLAQFPEDAELRNYIDRAELGISQQRLAKAEQQRAAEALQRPAPAPIAAPSPNTTRRTTAIAAIAILGTVLAGAGALWVYTRRPASEAGPSTAARLDVSPQQVAWRWQLGQSMAPPSETVAWGASPAGMELEVDSGSPWLVVGASRIRTPEPLRFSLNPAGLGPGTYRSQVQLRSSAGGETRTIAVDLQVLPSNTKQPATPPPSIRVEPSSLSFRVRAGAASVDPQNFKVAGSDGAGFRVTFPEGSAWLSVNRSEATVPATLSLQPRPAALPPGQHRGVVQITTLEGNAFARAVVLLQVDAAPAPPETPAPKVETAVAPPPPPLPNPALYSGDLIGNISWRGTLAPGQQLAIGLRGPEGGLGAVQGRLPGEIPVSLRILTPGVRLEAEPAAENRYGRFILVNTTSNPVSFIQVRWEVKR